MPTRMTPSQWKSKVRQAQQKHQQAISKYNREVQSVNNKINNKIKRAVSVYNNEVRVHNARVRADRQRLMRELARLSTHDAPTRYSTFRVTVDAVQTAYHRLESQSELGGFGERYNEVLDLSEREAANTAGLMNALLGNAHQSDDRLDSTESELTPMLQMVSIELGDRWRGALFALSPENPDAARHFCTSSREIIARLIDVMAPDEAISRKFPHCERNQRGTPTRRAKVRYILHLAGISQDELEDFVEADVDNLLGLLELLSKGTHGAAGKFELSQLQAIRQRVEDGIMFLAKLIR